MHKGFLTLTDYSGLEFERQWTWSIRLPGCTWRIRGLLAKTEVDARRSAKRAAKRLGIEIVEKRMSETKHAG